MTKDPHGTKELPVPDNSDQALMTTQRAPHSEPVAPEALAQTLPSPSGGVQSGGAPVREGATNARCDEHPGPGQHLGPYVIEGVLGAGGMGMVYCAFDPNLRRYVAIKLLLPAQSGSSGTGGEGRLMREAQAMARLSHPNILTVYEVTRHEGRVMIVMELVEGETLSSRLKTEPPLPVILDLFTQAARGLEYAHKAGLVHRDFKPDNVLVDQEGRVRIMDFGLARYVEESGESAPSISRTVESAGLEGSMDPVTKTGSVMGTPAYMSPEQFLGQVADARSDQFSFCVALFEALHGVRPFEGETYGALLLSVTSGEVRTVSGGAGVPLWLRTILGRGLSHDPQNRFESMSVLLAALERGRGRRRRLILGLIAAVGLLALIVVGVTIFQSRKETADSRSRLARSRKALQNESHEKIKSQEALTKATAERERIARHLETLRKKREKLVSELVAEQDPGLREELACRISGLSDVLSQPGKVLPASVIRSTLKRCRGSIRRCYLAILEKQSKIQGVVQVKLHADKEGIMQKVTILRDTIHSPELIACMKRKMMKWTFPTGGSDTALEISYPYHFQIKE
ncbi:protein kinase [Myxococcota bacterium]|nr:protein kinase [Myxococcota bacterium]